MDAGDRDTLGSRMEPWPALALSAGVVLGWVLQQLVPYQPDDVKVAAPDWLPLVAAGFAATGTIRLDSPRPWLRAQSALRWIGVLLMVWVANGLPFDVLAMGGLIGHRTASGAVVLSSVYWPGLATRVLALAAAVVLARLALARPAAGPTRATTSYAYAAFALALPYPVLRMYWAQGGTIGLRWPGAAGEGFAPLLLAIPWVLAAAVSLLLVAPRHWMPRRLLLAAGWSATAIVATIGPAACWSLVSALTSGGDAGSDGIELWVFGLFYGSWVLWAIAGGAATRSYQLRTAAPAPAALTG
jgi:hypothetical protein